MTRQWVERAEEDLKNAEHTLTLGDDCPLRTVCFHGRQCAEKCPNALLTVYCVPFPKTHDLYDLPQWLPASEKVEIDPEALSLVNRFSVEVRYPGDWDPNTRRDARDAVRVARDVRATVRSHLPKSVLI